ncbi:hypothetical protein HMPREF0673_03017 [Leyella stercorea DSM 18206]|uniref:Uncharacterized protein n=1 Tax=Leyella stercorea DSM 18206 TaxID=1002367 RepID=G6B284_9BACT|nr:hypothetical protein HMPREF0673_03017 [Leyella stercorea DSM 18206]
MSNNRRVWHPCHTHANTKGMTFTQCHTLFKLFKHYFNTNTKH